MNVVTTVNGWRCERELEPQLTLADFLREDLGLTGTHLGCEHGACGACMVLFDGAAVAACSLLAVQADGHEITTVEGLSEDGTLTPLMSALRAHHGLQCGFCTPGVVVSATAFLREEGRDRSECGVRRAMAGNLCRCTGYQGIVDAIRWSARDQELGDDREV